MPPMAIPFETAELSGCLTLAGTNAGHVAADRD